MASYSFNKFYFGTLTQSGTFIPNGQLNDHDTFEFVERDTDNTLTADTNPDPSITTPETVTFMVHLGGGTGVNYGDISYIGQTTGRNGIIMKAGSSYYWYFTNEALSSSDYNTTQIAYSTQNYVYCFLKGTRIKTVAGDTPVEHLNIGDRLLDVDGREVGVKWMGRQKLHPLDAKLNGNLPIRISAGALGDGLPERDLFMTPDHAMLVDGCLVHASALVNGRTIVQASQWDGELEYFHVETEKHEIILAEGAPAETFIDNVSREKFDNHAEYATLYPDAAPMVELDLPRVKFERQLSMAIKRRLAAVADGLEAREAKAA